MCKKCPVRLQCRPGFGRNWRRRVLAGILGICRLLRAAVGFADDAGGDYVMIVAVIYRVANCVRDINCCRCGV